MEETVDVGVWVGAEVAVAEVEEVDVAVEDVEEVDVAVAEEEEVEDAEDVEVAVGVLVGLGLGIWGLRACADK